MSDDLSLSLDEKPQYKLDPLGVVLNYVVKDIAECTASHDARPRRKLEGMPLATTFFRLGYFQPEVRPSHQKICKYNVPSRFLKKGFHSINQGAEGPFLLVLKVAFLALLVTQVSVSLFACVTLTRAGDLTMAHLSLDEGSENLIGCAFPVGPDFRSRAVTDGTQERVLHAHQIDDPGDHHPCARGDLPTTRIQPNDASPQPHPRQTGKLVFYLALASIMS